VPLQHNVWCGRLAFWPQIISLLKCVHILTLVYFNYLTAKPTTELRGRNVKDAWALCSCTEKMTAVIAHVKACSFNHLLTEMMY
jgi:hypothetical protein